MLWIVGLVLVIAIFGLGTLLEAAFWTLVLVAAIAVALVVAATRLLGS